MKRLLLLSVTLFSFVMIQAAPVDREIAHKKAEAFLGKKVAMQKSSNRATGLKEAPTYYIFNATDGKGFVILSGEDRLSSMIGYSYTGHMASEGDMPDALKLFLNTYQQYVEAYRLGEANDVEDVSDIFTTRRADSDNYLCKSKWGQDAPYNTLCPVIDDKQCPTGCVATALAQILYYWKWPITGAGYGNATDSKGATHHGTLEHTYNWSTMLNTTEENAKSAEAAEAVAQLLYDCGLAVGMTYGTDGSKAGTPIKAMYTNFGYIPTSLRTQMRECFASDVEWLSTIAAEIDAGRPVYESAESATQGGKDSSGHAFIIDGYDKDGNLHVNWGWDSDYDGFFAITKMNPAGYEYTVDQTIITGIEPAKNGETGEPTEYPYMKNAPVANQKGKIKKNVEFTITLSNIWNKNGNSHTWSTSIGLFDISGSMVADVKSGRSQSISLDSYYGIPETASEIPCKLDGTYPDGNYALRAIFKESGSKEWILPDMVGGLVNNAVYVKLSGNDIEFTDGTDYINAATGINILRSSSQLSVEPVRYFDLQGREVNGTQKGVLIRRQGSEVRKVMVK